MLEFTSSQKSVIAVKKDNVLNSGIMISNLEFFRDIDKNLINKYGLEIIRMVDCRKDQQTHPMLRLKHGSLKFLSKRGYINSNTKISVNFMYNILTI